MVRISQTTTYTKRVLDSVSCIDRLKWGMSRTKLVEEELEVKKKLTTVNNILYLPYGTVQSED